MKDTDEIQIREIIRNWERAVNAKDINGVLASHSDDVLLFDVVEPLQSKGIDAYKLSWEQQFFPWYGKDGAFQVHDLSVTVGNDVAFCYGIINCRGTENGQKLNLKIRLTIGLQKVNSKWIIMHEHHSETAK